MGKFILTVFVGMLQMIFICGICCICPAQAGEMVTFEFTLPDTDFYCTDRANHKPIVIIIQSEENKKKSEENKKSKCQTYQDEEAMRKQKILVKSCPEGEVYHTDVKIERYFYKPTLETISQVSTVIEVGMKYYVEVAGLTLDRKSWKFQTFSGTAKSTVITLHLVNSWKEEKTKGNIG